MGRLTALAAAAAAILLLAGAGCGERREPTGPSVDLYPVTVQGAGDTPTALRGPPRRIAAVGRGLPAILAALGAGDRVLQVAPNGEALSTLTGATLAAALGRLLPDLIVTSTDVDPEPLQAAVAATRAALYVLPATSLADLERGYTQLGLLIAEPAAARGLVHRLEEERSALAGRLRGRSETTVFVDTGFFTTIGSTSLLGDLIREARGRSVAGRAPGSEPFSLTDLIRLNPEVYLATADSETTLVALRRNPRTRRLRAVREGRFDTIPPEFLDPGPQPGAVLDQLARFLHPDAFR